MSAADETHKSLRIGTSRSSPSPTTTACAARPSLVESAKTVGILVFPGFETVTKDGVHFLCLFDPAKDPDPDVLERVLGDCAAFTMKTSHLRQANTTPSSYWKNRRNGARPVLPPMSLAGEGFLATLSGQARINAWTSPDLLACCLPGPVSDAPDNLCARYWKIRTPSAGENGPLQSSTPKTSPIRPTSKSRGPHARSRCQRFPRKVCARPFSIRSPEFAWPAMLLRKTTPNFSHCPGRGASWTEWPFT